MIFHIMRAIIPIKSIPPTTGMTIVRGLMAGQSKTLIKQAVSQLYTIYG